MMSRRGSSRRRILLTASRPSTTVRFAASVMGNSSFNARGGSRRTISFTCKFCVGCILFVQIPHPFRKWGRRPACFRGRLALVICHGRNARTGSRDGCPTRGRLHLSQHYYRITISVGANNQTFGGLPDKLSRSSVTGPERSNPASLSHCLAVGPSELLISLVDSSNRSSNSKKRFLRGR